MMNYKSTYHLFLLMLIIINVNTVFAQRDVVFHHRNNIGVDIQDNKFDDISFSKDVFIKNFNDTVKVNLMRIWEREMILLFQDDFKRLIGEILYNDREYYEDEIKRKHIKPSLRQYFPYYYVDRPLRNDFLEKVIFDRLSRDYLGIHVQIDKSENLNDEEKSFLKNYVQLYLFYANEECPEEILTDLIQMAKAHIAKFPISRYNDFIQNYILKYEYPSNTNSEIALAPIGYYFPVSGDLNFDIISKLNLMHLNLGLSYKNTFIKASGGFSFLKFEGYHDPDDNLGFIGLNGQVVAGHDFHLGMYDNWTISPFIGINYMIFKNKLFNFNSNGVLYDDLSPLFGVNFDYNTNTIKNCQDNTMRLRNFHRLQLGFSPMAMRTSGHDSGLAIMVQYVVGVQKNIKKRGSMFH